VARQGLRRLLELERLLPPEPGLHLQLERASLLARPILAAKARFLD
jgi:hypothetical protein